MSTRADHEIRPTGGRGPVRDRAVLGFRWRHLDLVHNGRTFLRRRGLEHVRLGEVLVHRLDAPDPGLDTHDHPWPFVSIVLRGGYTEEWAEAREAAKFAVRGIGNRAPTHRGRLRTWRRWSIHRMPLHIAHRIVRVEPGTVTLVVHSRKVRRWGFFLPPPRRRWVDWEAYDYAARRPVSVASNRPEERMP